MIFSKLWRHWEFREDDHEGPANAEESANHQDYMNFDESEAPANPEGMRMLHCFSSDLHPSRFMFQRIYWHAKASTYSTYSFNRRSRSQKVKKIKRMVWIKHRIDHTYLSANTHVKKKPLLFWTLRLSSYLDYFTQQSDRIFQRFRKFTYLFSFHSALGEKRARTHLAWKIHTFLHCMHLSSRLSPSLKRANISVTFSLPFLSLSFSLSCHIKEKENPIPKTQNPKPASTDRQVFTCPFHLIKQ